MDSQYDPLLNVKPPDQKFGEIYCNYMGVLSFHCSLCPVQMNHDDFVVHYMIHLRDVFVIKEEVSEDSNLIDPNFIGIEESDSFPAVEEIKLEIPQPSSSVSCVIKSESRDSEDSCSEQSVQSEIDPPKRRKRGRPKNSVKFSEPKECGICGKTFELRTLFKEHIRIHQCGPTPNFFECDICGSTSTKFKNLIDHFRYKHTPKIKCEICKKLIRRNYRKAHIRRHKNERNFKCTVCEKAFVMAGDLTTHLKLHHSAPPIKTPSSKKFVEPKTCDVCGQKFIGISAYERHLQSHGTTSSLYQCDICGRRIKEKKNLLSHMLFRHSNTPKLKEPCLICGKVFNRKYLKLHVRKHNLTNQQPSHICPICGRQVTINFHKSLKIMQMEIIFNLF